MEKRGYRSRVMVTGSSGFIGQNLVPKLKEKYDVLEWDLEDGNDIFSDEFENWVSKEDVVIHLAAVTSVNGSFKNPQEHLLINALGTARVLYLCHKYKIKLIFPSTAAVYFRDLSPYAKSKAIAEDMVTSMIGVLPVTILRFYNVYGPNMNKNSGSIMYNFLTEKDIVVYGSGEQTRDFISVNDVTNIIVDAIKKKYDHRIVDVGTGQSYTINYIAELFAHYRKLKVGYHDAPKREIKWSIANTSVLDALYGIKNLTTNLEKDIKALCQN